MDHDSGQLVGGRYRLDRVIGAGGSAAVWRAEDKVLSRRVAVKFLDASNRHKATVERRFLREARIAAAVRHPNVVEVFDFGMDDDVPYMVMELLEGASLAERALEAPPLFVAELLDVIDGVLQGLVAVHRSGIIHRDIKPENIFLTEGPVGNIVPKIFDFGVSRISDGGEMISAATTVEGYLVGTPHYMSSEQARGKKELDERTDVYSVGVVLYELLTGKLPFDAELMGDLVIKIATEPPTAVIESRPEIGRGLSEIVDRAMAKLPQDRFQDAASMRRELSDLRAAGLGDVEDLDSCASDRTARRSNPGSLVPAAAISADHIPMPWDRGPDVSEGVDGDAPGPAPFEDWGTDFDLPPAAASRPRLPLFAVLAAVALLFVGTGVWYVLRSPSVPAETATAPPAEPALVVAAEGPTALPQPESAPQTSADLEQEPEPEPVVAPETHLEPEEAAPVSARRRTSRSRRRRAREPASSSSGSDIFRNPDF